MNFLLSLNKKFFFIFCILVFLIIFITTLSIYFKSSLVIESLVTVDENDEKLADISNPKFSINSNKEKILITANEGNFLNGDEILLKKNVVFKSNKFTIYSDNVIFDKKNLIASSKNQSKFVSKNALINSIGFDITENGSNINFKGKTKLTLK